RLRCTIFDGHRSGNDGLIRGKRTPDKTTKSVLVPQTCDIIRMLCGSLANKSQRFVAYSSLGESFE
ncbi:MAG: hypothetical protein ACREA9_00820, partial [Pyrinomonadaceae bacterium]